MRLFIAIEISKEIKTGLLKIVEKFKEIDAEVKWAGREGMHITLKFLGEADEKKKEEIIAIMKKVVDKKESFTVEFKGLGAFPDLKRPRVVWVGIERGREELKGINRELEASLSESGFPKEGREFEPHLTLGRVKSLQDRKRFCDVLTSFGNLALPLLNVTAVNLIESVLKREGAEYKTVVSCKL